jgi:DNA-binding winged helix-turn-helix (wHTH) protein/tetratricopeptide (TPR) repeat protein
MRLFNGVTFEASMRAARDEGGAEIIFTRQERAVLLELTRRAGEIVTREELVRVLAQTGRDPGQRNVDFIINRLRGRLEDDARQPRFIATQYGEGYVWIAQSPFSDVSGFIVIGPVKGDRDSSAAQNFVENLRKHLSGQLGRDRPVVVLPDFNPGDSREWSYNLEVTLLDDQLVLHAALALRSAHKKDIVATTRLSLEAGNAATEIIATARWVSARIWGHIAVPDDAAPVSARDLPLEVRLVQAVRTLIPQTASWRDAEVHLRQARQDKPDDPTLDVLWAFNMMLRLIHWPADPNLVTPEAAAALEDEMEALALKHLNGLDDKPLIKLAAAKLLFFVNRGHHRLALQLADEAFASSPAFGAAFAMRAQLLMCAGDIDEAIRLYDKGLELSEFGSEFYAYLAVLKCTALMAADRRRQVQACYAELLTSRPQVQGIALFFACSELPLSPVQHAILSTMSREEGQKMLQHIYRTSARHFLKEEHKANIMRGLEETFETRFGPGMANASREIHALTK